MHALCRQRAGWVSPQCQSVCHEGEGSKIAAVRVKPMEDGVSGACSCCHRAASKQPRTVRLENRIVAQARRRGRALDRTGQGCADGLSTTTVSDHEWRERAGRSPRPCRPPEEDAVHRLIGASTQRARVQKGGEQANGSCSKVLTYGRAIIAGTGCAWRSTSWRRVDWPAPASAVRGRRRRVRRVSVRTAASSLAGPLQLPARLLRQVSTVSRSAPRAAAQVVVALITRLLPPSFRWHWPVLPFCSSTVDRPPSAVQHRQFLCLLSPSASSLTHLRPMTGRQHPASSGS